MAAPRKPPPRPDAVRPLPERESISALITDELPKAREQELAPWCMAIADRIDKELVPLRHQLLVEKKLTEQQEKLAFCEKWVVQLLRIANLSCSIIGIPPETPLDDLEMYLRSRLDGIRED